MFLRFLEIVISVLMSILFQLLRGSKHNLNGFLAWLCPSLFTEAALMIRILSGVIIESTMFIFMCTNSLSIRVSNYEAFFAEVRPLRLRSLTMNPLLI